MQSTSDPMTGEALRRGFSAAEVFADQVREQVLKDWRFAWQALAASCRTVAHGAVTPGRLDWHQGLIVKLQRNYESALRTAEIFGVDLAGPFHELPVADREEVLGVIRAVRMAEAVKRAALAKG